MTKLLGVRSCQHAITAWLFTPTLSQSPLDQGAGSYAFIFILFDASDSLLET